MSSSSNNNMGFDLEDSKVQRMLNTVKRPKKPLTKPQDAMKWVLNYRVNGTSNPNPIDGVVGELVGILKIPIHHTTTTDQGTTKQTRTTTREIKTTTTTTTGTVTAVKPG